MGNVAGEQGLAPQQHFPYKLPYSFKTSDCHKISSFNDAGLKFGHLDIHDMLFPFALVTGLCFTTLGLIPMVSIARLSVVKQSSFGLPGQYGRRVTRVNFWHLLSYSP